VRRRVRPATEDTTRIIAVRNFSTPSRPARRNWGTGLTLHTKESQSSHERSGRGMDLGMLESFNRVVSRLLP
jgi:hypothetical protein